MKVHTISVGSVEVAVQFKPIKNLHLSVHPPDGKVTVSSPEFYDLDKVKIYLATKLSWIKREQKKITGQEREGEKLYITRESHQVLGKRYLLKVVESEEPKIELKQRTLELQTNQPDDTAAKQKILYNWYRKELRNRLNVLVNKYATVMQLPVPKFSIRKMKTKWGSCLTDNKNIWFNIELAKKPIECVEYIVVHEMVHLLERHHNKNFIMLMDRYLPQWRLQKKILNDLPI